MSKLAIVLFAVSLVPLSARAIGQVFKAEIASKVVKVGSCHPGAVASKMYACVTVETEHQYLSSTVDTSVLSAEFTVPSYDAKKKSVKTETKTEKVCTGGLSSASAMKECQLLADDLLAAADRYSTCASGGGTSSQAKEKSLR